MVMGLTVGLALLGGVRWGGVPLGAVPLGALQLPLAPVSGAGETVTPAFEGWYENSDGTLSLSFGYFNRNVEEVLEIPVGPNNFIEPGDPDQGQPTHFQPRRHWGVFVVIVPADYAGEKVVWTLKIRGETFSIPANLKAEWKIDALEGEVGSGNTPPVLRFDVGGPEGSGPGGVTGAPLKVLVGRPLSLTVFARDDGVASGSVSRPGEEAEPVKLTWFKHQGPGDVTFGESEIEVEAVGGESMTTAMFSEPGNYILRVRANDASGVRGAGHAQCCWTNGFVKVTVTR